MPAKPKRPCRKSGCPGTTTERHGYCDKHKDLAGWSRWQSEKGNRHKRGYGSAWDKLRKIVLELANYLCQVCFRADATHVDHIKPKSQGGTNDLSNLQAICKACHAHKTATERRNK